MRLKELGSNLEDNWKDIYKLEESITWLMDAAAQLRGEDIEHEFNEMVPLISSAGVPSILSRLPSTFEDSGDNDTYNHAQLECLHSSKGAA